MLDVFISDKALGSNHNVEPSVSFRDNDVRYWFLYPFFECVHDQTQKMVDLYGDAVFRGKELVVLLDQLEQARDVVLKQPAHWLICFERETKPKSRPVFKLIDREDTLGLIAELQSTVAAAIAGKRTVTFVGD